MTYNKIRNLIPTKGTVKTTSGNVKGPPPKATSKYTSR